MVVLLVFLSLVVAVHLKRVKRKHGTQKKPGVLDRLLNRLGVKYMVSEDQNEGSPDEGVHSPPSPTSGELV